MWVISAVTGVTTSDLRSVKGIKTGALYDSFLVIGAMHTICVVSPGMSSLLDVAGEFSYLPVVVTGVVLSVGVVGTSGIDCEDVVAGLEATISDDVVGVV